MTSTPDGRRYDIDWLRVIATYLLLLFHVGMVFNPAPFYHIRNTDGSFVFLVVCGFISLWHMPLFFLLAGWSVHASLVTRGNGGFLKERFFKLGIPLIAACILLMPAIKYLELKSGLDANYTGLYAAAALQDGFKAVIPSGLPVAPPFNESFFEFLPTFFTDLHRFTWAHLWFLAYLTLLSILLLPVFLWLRRRRQPRSDPGALWVYAPAALLALIEIFMRPYWPGLHNLVQDWANIAAYAVYLLCGFALAQFPSIERAIHDEWKRALTLGTGASLFLLLGVLGAIRSPTPLLAATALASWCFVIGLVGLSHRWLSTPSPALRYLAASAFPVYLLHQSAIVLIGYPLIQLPFGIVSKFVLLLVLSTAATLLVYQLGVRRFALPRFLCGLKQLPRQPLPRFAQSVAALLAALFFHAQPSAAATPEGLWYAEGGAAKVEIRACGEELCGRVVWLRSPFDENGCELRDRHNPDSTLRDQPVVGLEILRELRPSAESPDAWEAGEIYDPTTGRTYSARLTLESEDRVGLRGYFGIPLLGRTTTWFRVGSEGRMCRQQDLQEEVSR